PDWRAVHQLSCWLACISGLAAQLRVAPALLSLASERVGFLRSLRRAALLTTRARQVMSETHQPALALHYCAWCRPLQSRPESGPRTSGPSVFDTLACLAVRDEFCQRALELGACDFIVGAQFERAQPGASAGRLRNGDYCAIWPATITLNGAAAEHLPVLLDVANPNSQANLAPVATPVPGPGRANTVPPAAGHGRADLPPSCPLCLCVRKNVAARDRLSGFWRPGSAARCLTHGMESRDERPACRLQSTSQKAALLAMGCDVKFEPMLWTGKNGQLPRGRDFVYLLSLPQSATVADRDGATALTSAAIGASRRAHLSGTCWSPTWRTCWTVANRCQAICRPAYPVPRARRSLPRLGGRFRRLAASFEFVRVVSCCRRLSVQRAVARLQELGEEKMRLAGLVQELLDGRRTRLDDGKRNLLARIEAAAAAARAASPASSTQQQQRASIIKKRASAGERRRSAADPPLPQHPTKMKRHLQMPVAVVGSADFQSVAARRQQRQLRRHRRSVGESVSSSSQTPASAPKKRQQQQSQQKASKSQQQQQQGGSTNEESDATASATNLPERKSKQWRVAPLAEDKAEKLAMPVFDRLRIGSRLCRVALAELAATFLLVSLCLSASANCLVSRHSSSSSGGGAEDASVLMATIGVRPGAGVGCAAQYLGAFAGAGAVYTFYAPMLDAIDGGRRVAFGRNGTAGVFVTLPHPSASLSIVLANQLFTSAAFMLAVRAVTDGANANPATCLQPLLVGLSATCLLQCTLPVSGCTLNPARDFCASPVRQPGRWATACRLLPAVGPRAFWAPLVGPYLGLRAGAPLVYELCFHRQLKVFGKSAGVNETGGLPALRAHGLRVVNSMDSVIASLGSSHPEASSGDLAAHRRVAPQSRS
uniref:ANK_REP_REGION domain-containing protein n=1 Tax=Macrostomum lignano TaxID=282301 RepID=A0A1I8JPQ5_9PLAT